MNSGGILLVEDDPTDVFLMQRSWKQNAVDEELFVAGNGLQAIEFLSRAGAFYRSEGRPLPRLILLDLQLPLKSGLEVLAWMQSQALIKRIPVVVFTSSLDRGDVDGAYDNGASGYFAKTGSLEALRELVSLWRDYWLIKGEVPGHRE